MAGQEFTSCKFTQGIRFIAVHQRDVKRRESSLIFPARSAPGSERKIYARSNSGRVNSRWQLISNSSNARGHSRGNERKGVRRARKEKEEEEEGAEGNGKRHKDPGIYKKKSARLARIF